MKIIYIDEKGTEKEVRFEELATRYQSSIRYYPAVKLNPIIGSNGSNSNQTEIIKIDYECNINCINCTNCTECVDCENCEDCDYCVGCTECKNCNFCYYCEGCEGCEECIKCKYCKGFVKGTKCDCTD